MRQIMTKEQAEKASRKICQKIRAFREASNYTNTQLCLRAGIEQANLYKMETSRDIRLSTLLRILAALGVTWEEFGKGP